MTHENNILNGNNERIHVPFTICSDKMLMKFALLLFRDVLLYLYIKSMLEYIVDSHIFKTKNSLCLDVNLNNI